MKAPNVSSTDHIASPAAKAASAIGAGAGTSMLSMSQQAQSFLPTDLGGWLAAAASLAALIYSLILISEWFWKRLFKGKR
jgi:hypothetical protein